MTRFKDRSMQSLYALYTETPPTRRGSGIDVAYHNGFERPELANRYIRNSLAYAAWAAGRDAARKISKVKP